MNKVVTSNEIYYKNATSIYDFTVKDSYMEEISIGDYCRGYVTIIVNIGSLCGFSPLNYDQLTAIYKKFDGSKIKITNNLFSSFVCRLFKIIPCFLF